MRRVVITGTGTVSPCGNTTEKTWDAVLRGKSGIERITLFDPSTYPSQIAGECRDFVAEKYVEKKRLREGDRFIHLALGAGEMAWESSGLGESSVNRDRVATIVGVGMCGLDLLYRTGITLHERGPRKVSPYFIPATIANLAPGQLSMRYGLRGPSFTTTSACSSGGHAIGEAFRWIRHGDIDAALAGGTEAAVTGLGVSGFTAMRALSTRNEAPAQASRPFDRERDGFVIAEGAAILVLEELEHAKQRGATILAEIVGYGATSDAYHLTQPAPGGEGAARAMHMALQNATLRPSDIDYINAHATSTPSGDPGEIAAMRKVFEDALPGISISSTKSMTGHLLGAAGGLEALFCVLAMRDQVAPPTINLEEPDPSCEGLDLVPAEAKTRRIVHTMSNSFGFGGTNVSLVLKQWAE